MPRGKKSSNATRAGSSSGPPRPGSSSVSAPGSSNNAVTGSSTTPDAGPSSIPLSDSSTTVDAIPSSTPTTTNVAAQGPGSSAATADTAASSIPSSSTPGLSGSSTTPGTGGASGPSSSGPTPSTRGRRGRAARGRPRGARRPTSSHERRPDNSPANMATLADVATFFLSNEDDIRRSAEQAGNQTATPETVLSTETQAALRRLADNSGPDDTQSTSRQSFSVPSTPETGRADDDGWYSPSGRRRLFRLPFPPSPEPFYPPAARTAFERPSSSLAQSTPAQASTEDGERHSPRLVGSPPPLPLPQMALEKRRRADSERMPPPSAPVPAPPIAASSSPHAHRHRRSVSAGHPPRFTGPRGSGGFLARPASNPYALQTNPHALQANPPAPPGHLILRSNNNDVPCACVPGPPPVILPRLNDSRRFWGPGATELVPCEADGSLRAAYKRARIEDMLDLRTRRHGGGDDPSRTWYWTVRHIQQVCADIRSMPAEERSGFGDLHKQLRELWFFHKEVSALYPPPGHRPGDMVLADAMPPHHNDDPGVGGSSSSSRSSRRSSRSSLSRMPVLPRVLWDFILGMNEYILGHWRPFTRAQPEWNVDSEHVFLEDFNCFLRHHDLLRDTSLVLMQAPQAPGWQEQNLLSFSWRPFRGYYEREQHGLTVTEEQERARYEEDSSGDSSSSAQEKSGDEREESRCV